MGLDEPHLRAREETQDQLGHGHRPGDDVVVAEQQELGVVLAEEAVVPFGVAEVLPEPLVGETGAPVGQSGASGSWVLLERPAFSEQSPRATTVSPSRSAARALCSDWARASAYLSSVAGVNACATVCTRRLDRDASACDTALPSPENPDPPAGLTLRQYLRRGAASGSVSPARCRERLCAVSGPPSGAVSWATSPRERRSRPESRPGDFARARAHRLHCLHHRGLYGQVDLVLIWIWC